MLCFVGCVTALSFYCMLSAVYIYSQYVVLLYDLPLNKISVLS